MSNSHVKHLMENAEDLVPVLYDHARKLAAREYRWRAGKSLPLGKTPEDIVREVYVSYIKGEGSEGKRIKGVRHFDPNKDLMFQLKGAIRSAMWALADKSSAKHEQLSTTEEGDAEPTEFAPTDSSPAERAESADFAKAVVEGVKAHPKFKESLETQDLFAAFELEITEVPDQARELGKKPEQICQLRYQLRQIYSEVMDELNKD
jgi:hypothetical protein